MDFAAGPEIRTIAIADGGGPEASAQIVSVEFMQDFYTKGEQAQPGRLILPLVFHRLEELIIGLRLAKLVEQEFDRVRCPHR